MDVAEVIVLLLVDTLALQGLSHALHPLAPPREDPHDVSSVLHGYDAHVILFVNPHEKVFFVPALDAPALRPVSAAARHCQQSWSCRLLEQVTVFSELGCFVFRHAA